MSKRKRRQHAAQKTVLGNGLTVITERLKGFRSLSIGIWIKAGTRHEKPKEGGVSHFLEHMLFKGTEKRSALEVAREIDQVGGEFNAFTAREYTCFHVTLLDRDLDLGMEILSDVLLNSTFDSDEFDRERKVILQEISMVEEAPEELVHDLFFELVYPKHGLGRPILGTAGSIRRMSRRDLKRYFQKHYCSAQVIVSVAGNISHRRVLKKLGLMRRKDWPGRPMQRQSRRELGFEPAPRMKAGHWWIPRNTEQVHLVWGVEGPKYSSRDRYAASVLNAYLGGGMSSALFQEIREKNGLAYTVYAMLWPFADAGAFTIYVATQAKQVTLCLKLIEESMTRLRQNLLSDEELQMVKDNIKGTLLLGEDNAEARMTSLARNEIFFQKQVSLDEICRAIDQVTPADVRRVARKLLHAGHRSLLAMGPKPRSKLLRKLGFHVPLKYRKRKKSS